MAAGANEPENTRARLPARYDTVSPSLPRPKSWIGWAAAEVWAEKGHGEAAATINQRPGPKSPTIAGAVPT